MKINKLSSPHLKVWSHDSSLWFSTVQNHTIQAGQILSLHLEAISNFPSAPTDIIYYLQDDLPIYFNFSLLYNLKFNFIRIINVADKAITLPPDTLLATAIFPCQDIYLHEVSTDTLKHEKTFNQDALHANLHHTVAKYFDSKAKQASKVVIDDFTMLAAETVSSTLPDTIERHPKSNDKEAKAPSPEHMNSSLLK